MIEQKIFEEKIKYYFGEYKIEIDEDKIDKFYAYANYLISENEKYNLTAIKNFEDIILNHFVDSVMPIKYFDLPNKSKSIDIGTGAGFPALPLYIINESFKFTLLDSSKKKLEFVKNATELIEKNPSNFLFVFGRAEEYANDINFRESYDCAFSRAVAKLNILCELASPFIAPGGFLIAYKSKNAESEIFESKNALEILGLKITETANFILGEKKRTLIKITKYKSTPVKYPRKYAEIIKRPL